MSKKHLIPTRPPQEATGTWGPPRMEGAHRAPRGGGRRQMTSLASWDMPERWGLFKALGDRVGSTARVCVLYEVNQTQNKWGSDFLQKRQRGWIDRSKNTRCAREEGWGKCALVLPRSPAQLYVKSPTRGVSHTRTHPHREAGASTPQRTLTVHSEPSPPPPPERPPAHVRCRERHLFTAQVSM